MRKTDSISKWFLVVTTALFIAWMAAMSGKAASYSLGLNRVSVENLISSNAAEYASMENGAITAGGEQNVYCFSVPQAGYVKIIYQGTGLGYGHMDVMSSDLTTLYRFSAIHGTEDTPETTIIACAFEAGNYAVRIQSYSSRTGSYRIGGIFAPAGNNETEPNEGFTMAARLYAGSANRITGFLSETDQMDYYKLVVPSEEKAKITYTTMTARSYFRVFNQNGQLLNSKYVDSGSESQPTTTVYETTLEAGTCYIQIASANSNTGRYYLSWEDTDTAQNIIKVSSITVSGTKKTAVGASVILSAKVSPANAANKTVIWKSANPEIAKISSSGVLTGIRPGKATVTAAAADGSGATKSVTIVVSPKKTAGISAVSKSKRTAKVSWKKQNGVSGYQIQYSTKASLSGAKYKKVSASAKTATLKKLSSGRKYYIRIRAYKKTGKKVYYGA